MSNDKIQFFEGYKKLYKYIVNIFICIVFVMLFGYMWLRYFNQYMDREFVGKGNIVFILIYGGALFALYKAFGADRLGYDRLANVVVAGILALFCSNILTGIQIELMVANIEYIWVIIEQMLMIFLVECIVEIILVYIFTLIYNKLFPPYKVLEIRGNRSDILEKKLALRKDKYLIQEVVSYNIEINTLKDKIRKYDAVLLNDIPSTVKNDILKFCFEISKRVYFTPKISDILIHSAGYINLFDSPLYLCRNYGLTFEQRCIKRIMDILVSLFGLIITLPITICVGIIIKVQDGGPVFFTQERCTLNGKIFKIYKFRSMVVDAEKEGKPQPAVDNDKRITKIGKYIRRTRIDELPQLINILKGDMSLIGPRPERKEHVEIYSEKIPEFVYRLKVKGGLTGYAQVYGKYNTTPYDKLKMDLQYIVDYSIFMDFQIIFETIKIIFRKNSTEGFTSKIKETEGDR